jgi:hypothetical protein
MGREVIKPRRVAILAGNYHQYLTFCWEQGWPENGMKLVRNGECIQTVYCDSEEKMCGWRPDEFIRTGTWYTQPVELIARFDFFKADTETRRGHTTRSDRDDDTTGC